MKKTLLFFSTILFISSAFAQVDTADNEKVKVNPSDRKDKTSVTIIEDEIISVDENNDTTRIKIGKKGISIVETPTGTKIEIHNLDDTEKEKDREQGKENEKDRKSDSGKFKGHWSGIQAGLNNYVNADFSTSLDNTMDFMDLNTGRSWTYSFNFMEHSFGFGTDKTGIVTGLGIEWSNYNFDRNFSIQKDSAGTIIPYPLTPFGSILKNKLQTTFLTVPLLIEIQVPAGKNRIYFSAGPVGAVKLGSHTKIVYKENGDRKKIKDKDDFNLNPLRYGITLRAGYKGLNLFATYYLNPLFETDKGPELYPFSIGLNLMKF